MRTVVILSELVEIEMMALEGKYGAARLKAYLTRIWNYCTPGEKAELAGEFKSAAEGMGIEF